MPSIAVFSSPAVYHVSKPAKPFVNPAAMYSVLKSNCEKVY